MLSIQLKSTLHIMIYSVLLHKINLAVKIKSKVISMRHSKKLKIPAESKATEENYQFFRF